MEGETAAQVRNSFKSVSHSTAPARCSHIGNAILALSGLLECGEADGLSHNHIIKYGLEAPSESLVSDPVYAQSGIPMAKATN